jgi:hypothetical protein
MSGAARSAAMVRWVQPKWSARTYELRTADDTVIAKFEYRGKWRTTPVLTFEGEELTFKGRGFFKTDVAIMRGDQEIALYKPKSFSGVITFINGSVFTWKSKGFFSGRYVIVDADNEEVMTFRSKTRWFRSEAEVTLAANAQKYPELRILTAIGWYIMMASAQAATAAT